MLTQRDLAYYQFLSIHDFFFHFQISRGIFRTVLPVGSIYPLAHLPVFAEPSKLKHHLLCVSMCNNGSGGITVKSSTLWKEKKEPCWPRKRWRLNAFSFRFSNDPADPRFCTNRSLSSCLQGTERSHEMPPVSCWGPNPNNKNRQWWTRGQKTHQGLEGGQKGNWIHN